MTISHQPATRLVMKSSAGLDDQIPGADHQRSVIAAKTSGSGQGSDTGQFEPLLDTGEAARLLRIHPRTLLRKRTSWKDSRYPDWTLVAISRFCPRPMAENAR